LIEAIIVGIAIGSYIFYGQILVDWLQTQAVLPQVDSSQLYALVAVVVVLMAELLGMLLTRGMK